MCRPGCRSPSVSPFSKAAQQPSDTGDVTQVHTMTLEPASSIKSPLKLPPQGDAPADEEAQVPLNPNCYSLNPKIPQFEPQWTAESWTWHLPRLHSDQMQALI